LRSTHPEMSSASSPLRATFNSATKKKFIEQVLRVQDGVVVLGSNGGNLNAGLEIGKAIHLTGLKTFVPDGVSCASACAIAWLAGTPRFMGRRARIGFHAAYRKVPNGNPEISAPANASAGAYLGRLGSPDRAILYITSAPPTGMTWLSFEDAEKVGIEVNPFQIASDAQPSPAPQKGDTVPSAPKPAATEKANIERVQPSPPQTASVEALPTVPSPRVHGLEAPQVKSQILDLSRADAASQVRRRLQERGFFFGTVDGVWGRKSRIALREFKSVNQIGADDGWDLKVQLVLFDDSSRSAPAGYTPPDASQSLGGLFRPFPLLNGTGLHPLNVLDAISIQSKLSESGYYRGTGDGTRGPASQTALRDFKVANGLVADDGWDSEVEALLTGGRVVPASETPFGDWALTGTSCDDPNNPRRLSVSAVQIVAGGGVCRLEQSLSRSGDRWSGLARCSREGQEAAARVAL
jgi:peptidoglycan hydrolase-like protein with peptidoglycan-binding domain